MSEINVGTAVAYLTMKDAGFSSGIAQAQSALSSFDNAGRTLGQNLSVWSSALGSLGTSLTTTFTLPIVKLAESAIQTSMDLDTTMSQVRATLAITRDSTEELSDEVVNSSEIFQKFRDKLDISEEGLYNTSDALTLLARQLGRDTVFSAEEAADAINVLAMAGYDTNQIILALPEVLNLAAAGSLEIADAADYATGIMAGFNMEADEMSSISNILAAMASNAKGSVSDFGQGLSTVAGMASVTNQSIEDVSVALAILGNHNVSAAEGGNALARALRRLYQPTDNAKVALEELGVSIYDTEGNARALPDVLLDLNGALSNLTEKEYAEKISTIFGAVSSKTVPFLINDVTTAWEDLDVAINHSIGTADLSQVEFNKMIRELVANYKKAGGNVEKFYEDMQEYLHLKYNLSTAAAEETLEKFVGLMQGGKTSAEDFQEALGNIGGAASQMAKQQLDNLQGDITLLKDAFAELQVVLVGDDGFLRTVVQTITEVVNAFASMSQAQRDQVVQIGLVIAALGPALLIISKILSVLSNIATALEIITSLNPLIAALVGIVAMLAIGFEEAYNSSEDFRGLLETIGGQLETLQNGFKHLWEEIKNSFQPVWDNLRDTAKEMVSEDLFPTFSNVLDTIWKIFEDWKPVLAEVAQLLADIASDYVLPAISEVFSTICDLINDHLPSIESLSSALATMASEVVLPAIRAALEGIKEAVKSAWPYIKKIISQLSEEFSKRITNIATMLKSMSDALKDFNWTSVSENWESFKEFISLLASPLKVASDAISDINKEIEKIRNLNFGTPQRQGERFADTLQWIVDAISLLGDTAMYCGLALADMYNYAMILLHPFDIDEYASNIRVIEDQLTSLEGKIGKTADSMHINFAENAKKDIEDFARDSGMSLEEFSGTLEKESNKWSDVIRIVDEEGNDITDSVNKNTNNMADSVITFVDDSSNKLQGDWHDVITFVDEDQNKLADSTNEATKNMTDSVITFVDDSDKELTGSWHDVITFVDEDQTALAKSTDTSMSNMSDSVISFGDDSKGVLGTMREDLSDTGDSVSEFSDGVLKDFEDMSDTKQYGKDTIENLKDGMQEEEKGLKSWLNSISSWINSKLSDLRNGFSSLRDARNDYDGSYASGLSYVPYNGFIAQLHEGERILTKEENREYNSGSNGSGGDTFNFYNTQPDPYEYARQMKRAKKELLLT